MNKKLIIIAFVLVALVLSAADNPFPATLTVRNRSGETVYIQLTGEDDEPPYFFTIPTGETMTFEVERGTYSSTTTACDDSSEGVYDLNVNVRLAVPNCHKQYRLLEQGIVYAYGEPKVEKLNTVVWPSEAETAVVVVDETGKTFTFTHPALSNWWLLP